jgi:hypothetical protein
VLTEHTGPVEVNVARDRAGTFEPQIVRDTDPAGPGLLLADGYERISLADLPSDHGRPAAANPNYHDGRLRPDYGY